MKTLDEHNAEKAQIEKELRIANASPDTRADVLCPEPEVPRHPSLKCRTELHYTHPGTMLSVYCPACGFRGLKR
jgi:hypothetical protein